MTDCDCWTYSVLLQTKMQTLKMTHVPSSETHVPYFVEDWALPS